MDEIVPELDSDNDPDRTGEEYGLQGFPSPDRSLEKVSYFGRSLGRFGLCRTSSLEELARHA
jgi:hypothetical protein